MNFSEYAQMLYPFCGDGLPPSELVTALIGYITEDSDKEKCPLLDAKPEYLTRIYNGKKPIPLYSATFVTSNLDKGKFETYIRSLSVDTIQGIAKALAAHGIETTRTDTDVAVKCADLLESIMRDIAKGSKCSAGSIPIRLTPITQSDLEEKLSQLDKLLAAFPQPPALTPPAQIEEHEEPYVTELYAAYGEAENVPDFCAETLANYATYSHDLKDRRIDYFAAESIRRGVSEHFNGALSNQFDELKAETLAGVKNTARRRFSDGYERMLTVMEQAVQIPVDRYLLSRSPNWISNNIKMGVCHFLVNDGQMKWVNFRG